MKHKLSFRCYFPDNTYTNHYQELEIKDIGKWIKAYQFTHPDVTSITTKVWLTKGDKNDDD